MADQRWKLVLKETPLPLGTVVLPGWCWFEPAWATAAGIIAPKYLERWKGVRLPLVVQLPGRSAFCVDTRARNEGGWYGDGWDVTGDPEHLTVSPSINLPSSYHGWIRDGWISDDCEGRQYADDGSLIRNR